jgi:FkbM family methyltransferase
MRSKLRRDKNILLKANRGVGIANKFFLLLNCLEIELSATSNLAKTAKQIFWKNQTIKLNVRHVYCDKECILIIRLQNRADTEVLAEFLAGGLYYEAPQTTNFILDCGANIGLFAIHAGLLFPNAKIVCYEPEPKNFELLQKNLEANGILADCRKCGVWSSEINGFFHPAESFNGHISLNPSAYPIRCEVPEITPQTWLKLDVEGAEYEVLPKILSQGSRPQIIAMEVHDYHRRGQLIRDMLIDAEYKLTTVTDGSPAPESAIISARQAG